MAISARLIIALTLMVAPQLANEALAQDYPSKPIRILNGQSPEIICRIFGKIFTDTFGQSVVVESIPGVGGRLAAEALAKSRPDGHTLLNVTASFMIFQAQQKGSGDLSRDFAPVAMTSYTPFVLIANGTLPVTSVQELIALAKAKPGQLNYGANTGNFPHLAFDLFNRMAKTDIVHIAYKRPDDMTAAVLSGQVHAVIMPYVSAAGMSKIGKVRTLAVTTAQRSKTLPDVPTISESGLPGYDLLGWTGFVVPLGTPAVVVAKLNAVVRNALKQPDLLQQLAGLANDPGSDFSPEQFGEFLKIQKAKWTKIVDDAGFKIN